MTDNNNKITAKEIIKLIKEKYNEDEEVSIIIGFTMNDYLLKEGDFFLEPSADKLLLANNTFVKSKPTVDCKITIED